MKQTFLFITSAAIIISLLFACSNNGKEVARTTLLAENFAIENPDWQVSNDTIVKDFVLTLAFEPKTEIPFRLMWTSATDTASVEHVAFVQFDRMGGTDKVAVDSVTISELTVSRNIYTIAVGLKPAQPTKGTYWQGFRIDFSANELIIAMGIEEQTLNTK